MLMLSSTVVGTISFVLFVFGSSARSECDTDQWLEFKGQCYLVVDRPKRMTYAELICEQIHKALLSSEVVTNPKVADFLSSRHKTEFYNRVFWVGYRDINGRRKDDENIFGTDGGYCYLISRDDFTGDIYRHKLSCLSGKKAGFICQKPANFTQSDSTDEITKTDDDVKETVRRGPKEEGTPSAGHNPTESQDATQSSAESATEASKTSDRDTLSLPVILGITAACVFVVLIAAVAIYIFVVKR